MERSIKDYIFLSLKGIAMGAADVVPGVSGGTIAFITGIYEELLNTINSVNLEALKKLKTEGLKSFWKHINGNFIVALFLGIGISVYKLAGLITHLMETQATLLWSFFFGLIIASIYLVGKKVAKWDISKIIGLIIGTGVAFYITLLAPMENPSELWFVFLSGAIAICAMILPGISGSFILLLLGSYELVLTSIKDLKLTIIAVFGAGCVVGLLSFSKVLSWMFKKHHDLTIAILTGFLIGSLNKIWPWKETISTRVNSHDEIVPFIQENVLPSNFNGDSQLILAIVMALVGLGLILVLEKVANKE
jgi:putative membrane protein